MQLRFECNTDRRRRLLSEEKAATYHQKLNYGMKMFLWQKAVSELMEVEALLDKYAGLGESQGCGCGWGVPM